ncbi:hypothetical protein ACHAXT_004581 [Thalassiosira profunda]
MQPKGSAEKELQKENLYKDRTKEILKKHRGALQAAYQNHTQSDNGEDLEVVRKRYAAESDIIGRVMANERSAFLAGIALSGVAFVSVRFLPRYLAVRINPDKARKLREADEIAEKAGTRWMQKTAAFVFEASFGAWCGWRGYNKMSSMNASSYEEVSKIPLCSGRSRVAESVCPEWVAFVRKEVPAPFWSNVDDGDDCGLQDPQRWRAVRDFADNCVKRKVYEDAYRKKNGMDAATPVDVPKGGVPDNILLLLGEKKAG